MLAGIGGRTIAEAQERLSYAEFLSWKAFREKRGELHFGLRLDRNIGLFLAMYANTHSKNGGYSRFDFSPFEDEPELTLEEAMETWH